MSEMQALVFDLCRTLCFSPTPERKRELKLQYYIAILPKLAPVLSEAFPEIGQLTPETLLEQMTNVEARIFSLDIVDEQPFSTVLVKAIQACFNDQRDILELRDYILPVIDITNDATLFNFEDYVLFKDTDRCLGEFQAAGMKLVLIHNSNHEAKALALIKHLGIHKFFDLILITGDIGVQKPNERLYIALQEFLNIPFNQMVAVGDDILNDLVTPKRYNMHRLYIQTAPKIAIQDRNSEMINTTEDLYDHMICNLTQIGPYLRYKDIPNRLVVGYALAKYLKRWQAPAVGHLIDTEKILYRGIDVYSDIERQALSDHPFDAIVHKIHEIEVDTNPKKAEAWERVRQYERDHPEIPFIDPVSVSDVTMNRMTFLDLMSEFDGTEINGIKLRFPTSVTSQSDAVSIEAIEAAYDYPIFIKPNEGDATIIAHTLTIAFDRSGLQNAITFYTGMSVIIQSYISHNATLYKAYKLGDELNAYYKKPSCANLKTCDKSFVRFESWDSWPAELQGPAELSSIEIPQPTLDAIANLVAKKMNGSMFGLDIIIDLEGVHWIVDMNYFGSYMGFPPESDVQGAFNRHIEKIATRNK